MKITKNRQIRVSTDLGSSFLGLNRELSQVEAALTIDTARARLKAEIESLPMRTRHIAECHVERRLLSNDGKLLLGEQWPLFVYDLFSIQVTPALTDFHTAWLLLYYSVTLLDDVIDSSCTRSKPESLIASQLLLQRASWKMARFSSSLEFQNQLTQAFDHTAEAAVAEVYRRRHKSPDAIQFRQSDIDEIGLRSSLGQVCVAAALSMTEKSSEESRWIHLAFERFLTAVQLLDDLADWRDDLRIRNVTLPVSIFLSYNRECLGNTYGEIIPNTKSFILSGAPAKTLELIVDYIDDFCRRIENHHSAQAELVAQLRSLCTDAHTTLVEAETQLRRRLRSSSTKQERAVIEKAERALIIVAQSC